MKKKCLLFFCLLFGYCANLYAQAEDAFAHDTTYWDFGMYFSPNYNHRILAGDGSNGVSADFLNALEKARMGFSLGATVTRPLSSRLYLHTGLIYENIGYRTGILQDTVLDLYDRFLYSREFHSAYRYHCFDIPVILRIGLAGTSRVQVALGVGAAARFSLNKSEISFFGTHKERLVSKAERDVNVTGILNLNITFPLTDKLSFALEPAFRYGILEYRDRIHKGVQRNLWSAGLGLHLCYRVTDKQFYDYYYKHIYKKERRPHF